MNVLSKSTVPVHSEPWQILVILLVLVGILTSSIWIFTPYSYWYDELWSVTAAEESFSSMHSLLLGDVHPPFYQIVLKVWIAIFGNSEISTRILSWIFANAAALYFYRKSARHGYLFSATAILFFVTNWLYAFYANETRSYAMALFFATVVATNYPKAETKPSLIFLAAAFLLSVTHYFGLILAGVNLGVCAIQNIKNRRFFPSLFAVGFLCSLWPAYHIFSGELLNKTGGNFWIKVNGILDSLSVIASAYMPLTGAIGGFILVGGLLVAIGSSLKYRRIKGHNSDAIAADTFNVAIVTLIFIGLVAVMDFWSPVSVHRYYIVLLPYFSFSLAGVVTLIVQTNSKGARVSLAIIILFCVFSQTISLLSMNYKSRAYENWKEVALSVINNYKDYQIYYIPNNEGGSIWQHLIFNFYIKKFSGGMLKAQPYAIGETVLAKPAVFIFGHSSKLADTIEEEMTNLGALQIYNRNGTDELKKDSAIFYVVN